MVAPRAPQCDANAGQRYGLGEVGRKLQHIRELGTTFGIQVVCCTISRCPSAMWTRRSFEEGKETFLAVERTRQELHVELIFTFDFANEEQR